MRLVKVKYRGASSDREYSYLYEGELEVGDLVLVPLGSREKHAIVTETYPIKEIIRVVEE